MPKYQARCKLTTETGPREVTIKTLDFDAPVDTKHAEQIREDSRLTYGRERNEVEEEIEKRLRITTTVARSATPTDGKQQEPEQEDLWVEIED